MAQPLLLTYKDALDACRDWLSGQGGSAPQRDILRAVQGAWLELASEFDWRHQLKHGRVILRAAESGTLSYDHTGGAYERLVTLDTGYTFPSWAEDAVLRVGDATHAIEDYKSTTTATLDVTLNPGADVATGTAYTIYPAWYHLPADFESIERPLQEGVGGGLHWLDPEDWLYEDRYDDSTGDPYYFTIMPVPDLHGTYGLFVRPPSDTTKTLDFLYRARPRQLLYSGETPGTVCTAGSISVTAGSATVTGSGTAFESGMVGSVLRIGRDAPNANRTNLPTGRDGPYPFAEERVIVGYTTPTSLTLDQAAAASRSGVGYCISDPIDVPLHCRTAFYRLCELQLAQARDMKVKGDAFAAYQRALSLAKGSDTKTTTRNIAGRGRRRYYDPMNGPVSDDVT